MPVHDWTRVDAGIFHHFHQRWVSALCDALNTGGLPPGYYALAEQVIGGPIPDVLTLQQTSQTGSSPDVSGMAVMTAPPSPQRIPAPLSRCPTTRWHADATGPLPICQPRAR